jgi:Fe2+ transport system protein FeoA
MQDLNWQNYAIAAPKECRLHKLDSGGRGVVRLVEGRDGAMARLMAMGLCVGREVEVVRQGNPLVLRFLGARVGLSRRIAERIVVEQRQA